MPDDLVREMVADWMGAGRAITGRWEVAEWYEANKGKMHLHPGTRALVESLVRDVSEPPEGQGRDPHTTGGE